MITGATGFIGKHILRALDTEGTRLIPVVRTGKEDHLPDLEGIERIVSTRDLFKEDESWWEAQCNSVDIVIHSAWYVEPGKYLQSDKNLDCLIGSLNLARGAAQAHVKRFVGLGTCAEYDQDAGDLSVDTALNPLTPYAAAKVALFFALSQWFPTKSISFAWCRLFYLYGEGEDERRLIPYIRQRLAAGLPAELTSGNQVRDFMNVIDAAKKIAEISWSAIDGPINVCSGMPITVRQLAERIAQEHGNSELLLFGARPDNQFDPPYVVGIPNA